MEMIHVLVNLDINAIWPVVTVVVFGTVGIVQFLKNFFPNGHARWWAILTVIVTAVSTYFNMSFVPLWATIFYDVFVLGLAGGTLAYQVVVDGLPNFFASIFKLASPCAAKADTFAK